MTEIKQGRDSFFNCLYQQKFTSYAFRSSLHYVKFKMKFTFFILLDNSGDWDIKLYVTYRNIMLFFLRYSCFPTKPL